MNKIPTMFERDWNGDRSRVTDQPVEACSWVFDGEGVATRKYDGTCVMYDGTAWWARREVRDGKTTPDGFVPVQHDGGNVVGWEPIAQSPFAKFHAEAVAAKPGWAWDEGTYELCGPKIQKNPEGFAQHTLVYHLDAAQTPGIVRTFHGIREALEGAHVEGFVFHHPDGRMAKIKARDFGIKR